MSEREKARKTEQERNRERNRFRLQHDRQSAGEKEEQRINGLKHDTNK